MRPILFHLNGMAVRAHWVLTALAFAVAAGWAVRRGRAAGLAGRQMAILAIVTFLSIGVGARAGYILLNWSFYHAHADQIFRFDKGGLTVFGGLLAAWITIGTLLRRWRLPAGRIIDRMMPPLVLGQVIARVGCFLQGCCYGYFTERPWGIATPPEVRPRHPTQLYELAALLGILAVMLFAERKGRGQPQPHFLIYGLLYGFFRFAADFLRADGLELLWHWKASQFLALPLAVICGLLLLRRRISCTRS